MKEPEKPAESEAAEGEDAEAVRYQRNIHPGRPVVPRVGGRAGEQEARGDSGAKAVVHRPRSRSCQGI